MSGRSTTSKYVKVKKDKDTTPENEIRMTGTNYVGKYITYAATLLLEKKIETIVLKATGIATKGACLVAEILRHRIVGLHQLNVLRTITVVDEYEPIEEGLDKVTVDRKLAVLEIFLSTKDGALDVNAAGYQKPLPKEEVQEEEIRDLLRRGGNRGGPRGGSRGGRGERRGGRRGGRGGRRGGRRDDDNDREDDREESGRRQGGRPRGGRRDDDGEGRRGDGEQRGRGARRGGNTRGGERGLRRGTYRGRGGPRGGRRGGDNNQ